MQYSKLRVPGLSLGDNSNKIIVRLRLPLTRLIRYGACNASAIPSNTNNVGINFHLDICTRESSGVASFKK